MSKYADSGGVLLGAFPYALARDEDKEKLAESIAQPLAKTVSDTDKALIFPAVDNLPEAVLDILAYDLKIDWYEAAAPIENKRRAVKECILVHKYKGTKYAVETALHSMFTNAKVEEWFEYGGEPFHFKLTVYGSTTGGGLKNLYLKVQYAKNLRSVMDDTLFIVIPDKTAEIFVGAKQAARSKRIGAAVSHSDDSVFTRKTRFYAAVGRCTMTKRLFAKVAHDGGNFERKTTAYGAAGNSAMTKRIHAAVSNIGGT